MRKRDRWGGQGDGSNRRLNQAARPLSLYNDTLHCAINTSMANTCSARPRREILAIRRSRCCCCFCRRIDRIRPLNLIFWSTRSTGRGAKLRARCQRETTSPHVGGGSDLCAGDPSGGPGAWSRRVAEIPSLWVWALLLRVLSWRRDLTPSCSSSTH